MSKKKSKSRGARARVRNPPTLKNCRVAVVGLNAVGYRIAQLLVSSGVRSLQLVDPRLVTKRDQLRDGYDAVDIGRPKAHAAAQHCHEINPRIEITGSTSRSQPDLSDVDVTFISGNARRIDNRESGTLPWLEVLATGSSAWSIRVDYYDPRRRGGQQHASPPLYRPSEAFIVAGVLVRQVIKCLTGKFRRTTLCISMNGLSVQIRVRRGKRG